MNKSTKIDKIVNVSVNWDNEDSIRTAEKTKAYLENKGYTLVNQFGGLFYGVLVYHYRGES